MTNSPVVTEPNILEEIREKTFDQILREQAQSRKEDPTEPLELEETEEDKKKKEEEEKAAEERKTQEAAEAQKKHDEEIATRAAQEVADKIKAEEQAKIDKLHAEEEEQKRQESLKPKFTGKDENGNTVPLSYEELHAEDVRVAKEEAKREVFAELEARERAKQEEAAQHTQSLEQQKAQQKEIEDQLQKELDSDLKAIYTAGDMPKIGDPKNENDEGNKAFKHLFETAQRVNGERIGKGLPAIRSIQMIRYGKDENGKPFYTPLEKPAGHDAPVLGSESSLSHEAPVDEYIPARDRGKSMTQLIKEEAARLGKKLNIRGN